MYPFIKDGDILTVCRLSDDSPHTGDVVAFVSPKIKKLLVHRVIKRKAGHYLVKGDNTFKADGFISREEILGRIAKIERDGKTIHFGLGRERLIIAYISKLRFVFPLILRAWTCIKSPSERSQQ
jgi:hypothetical protein